MRRTLWALALLLALALGGLTAAHLLVNAARDRVEVRETVLSGDPAAAAGLELAFCLQDQQGHLSWSTAFRPGEVQAAGTSFRFSAGEPEPDMSWARAPYVQLSSHILSGISGHLDLSDEEDFLFAMAADVARNTPAGGTRTETLRVEDYIAAYPLSLDACYDGWMNDLFDSGVWEDLDRYFQYRVAPGQEVEVSVTLDASGAATDITANYAGGQPYIASQGVVTERGAYFLAQAWDGGGPTDLLHCAQGQGIHFLPTGGEEGSHFDLAGLRLFYPLDPSCALYLGLTEDGGKLLLYTREAGRLILTVIDGLTGAPLQRLDLLPIAPDEFLNGTIDEGPLHLAALAGESGGFCLLEEGAEGVSLRLTGALDQNDRHQSPLASPSRDAALAWDGRRLIWAEPGVDVGSYRLCLRLGVWDGSGLQFLARYECSPCWDPSAQENPYQYPYRSIKPISLHLGENSLNFCEK